MFWWQNCRQTLPMILRAETHVLWGPKYSTATAPPKDPANKDPTLFFLQGGENLTLVKAEPQYQILYTTPTRGAVITLDRSRPQTTLRLKLRTQKWGLQTETNRRSCSFVKECENPINASSLNKAALRMRGTVWLSSPGKARCWGITLPATQLSCRQQLSAHRWLLQNLAPHALCPYVQFSPMQSLPLALKNLP